MITIICVSVGALLTAMMAVYYIHDVFETRKKPKPNTDSYGEIQPLLGVVSPKDKKDK
jgi:hypothetical protein